MSKESWAEITQCVGPWKGGGPMTMAYDIWVLGAGMDPYNVLTSICHRCGQRWCFDSPTGECDACERETLCEYLTDENRRLRGEPPVYKKPPPRPYYEVVIAPSFVTSYAEVTGTDEATARADLRKSGKHLSHLRPTPEDRERDELRRYMAEYAELDLDRLSEKQQAAWIKWWNTREDLPKPSEAAAA